VIKLHSLRAAKFKQLDDLSLAFPERGSVLIQGLNEAGKSTLFESVYFGLFGKALVTEEPNRLDDLINYQSPRAMVKLVFSTDGASFTVSRTLNRGKPNTAVLEIEYAGGKRETVTNLSSVNRRVVDELGLDAEALLNSCFVEQKKLEKLESMTAQQRRDTLLRLLNLDRLAALEASYKPSTNDDYQLQQLRDRLKLAEIQRDLPASLDQLNQIDAGLKLVSGFRLTRELDELARSIASQEQRQAELRDAARQVEQRLAEVDQLKNVRDLSRSAGEALLSIAEARGEIERVRQEQAAAQAAADRLPEVQAELTHLEALAADLAELASLEEAQEQRRRHLASLGEANQRVLRLSAAHAERDASLARVAEDLEACRAEVEEAERSERQMRQLELLRGWLQIREVALIAQEGERELARLESELGQLQASAAQAAKQRQAAQTRAVGAGLGGVLALAGGLVALSTGRVFGLAGLAVAAVLAFVALRFALAMKRAAHDQASAEAAAGALQPELNRREGERALALRTGQDPGRLESIEGELAELGHAVPASVAEAQQALVAAETAFQAGPAERSGTAELRQRLGSLESQARGLRAELAQLQEQIEHEGNPAQAIQQLERELAEHGEAVAANRQMLPETPNTEAEARELAAAARASRQAALAAAEKAAQALSDLALREERLRQREDELDALCDQLQAVAGAVERDVEACRALWRTTVDRLAALDEPELRRQASELGSALAAGAERFRIAEARAAEARAELEVLALAPEQLAGPPPASEELEERARQLQQEQRELFGRVASLKDQQASLEHQFGLQGVAVDYAEAEKELLDFEHRCQLRKQAHRIITLARRNIVGKVLPSTTRNMSLLLPLLTNDRYRDVDIDPETYKIKVWDEAARAMKAKDIFSGGTRDQFSLALRLAFALATLPEEMGAAPGFIFLDEPLSSFDAVRTNALVNLLTRGPVAANFEQIFVISHSRAFDEQLFDYHLQLDAGRIISSDLPATAEALEAEQRQLELVAG